MQHFNPQISTAAKVAFEKAVHELTSNTESYMKARVCLCCDCYLAPDEKRVISIDKLKKAKVKVLLKGTPGVPLYLREYYTVPDCPDLSQLLLSPRANLVVQSSENESGYLCCNECFDPIQNERRLPMFAIANDKTIGEAPECLTSLNPVEFALISKARTDKHIFQYYGGAHQSIRGWHTFYTADLNQLSAVVNRLESSTNFVSIATLLVGPFTTEQRMKVKEQSEVRLPFIKNALRWLSRNNIHYSDVDINAQFADKVICIDSSGPDCESTCSRVETKYEFTGEFDKTKSILTCSGSNLLIAVVFPDATEPSNHNGGTQNQEEFRDMTLDRLMEHSPMEATLIARSSHTRLRDYEDANLQKAFPLQFPYGFGTREVNQLNVTKESKVRTPRHDEYYRWLLKLSLPNMHRGDFILVIHNMFERYKAVNTSFLRARMQIGEFTNAELFSEMSSDDLQSAARRKSNNCHGGPRTTGERFLQSMDAITKGMAHSRGAAGQARSEMFSKCTRFGLPALFFTVTPEDHCNFRIQVLRHGKKDFFPHANEMNQSELNDIYEVCAETRTFYPGLCAIDFRNILHLVVRYVLGWNEDTQTGEEGAFGKILAFYGAVEEQARKTLHVHFIVWLQDWNELLSRLYSDESDTRLLAGQELGKFVDKVMSNKLHGNDTKVEKFDHDCESKDIEFCEFQDLRNLRHKKGQSKLHGYNIAKCKTCETKFDSEILAKNEIKRHGFHSHNDRDLFIKLQIYLMQESVRIPFSRKSERQKAVYSFVMNYMRNLHNSCHNRSCWKKGLWCRFLLPKMPSHEKTCVHFLDDMKNMHIRWDGIQTLRRLFQVFPKRAFSDVYVNSHHSWTSIVLACNTNVQVGLDGKHIMYCTLYTGKSTEHEDSERYLKVVKCLAPLIRRQQEELDESDEHPSSPFQVGYHRLLGAVLANTAAHVISAPLAAFIVHEGSRFIKSHKSITMPMPAFFKKQIDVKVEYRGERSYFNNLLFNYQYRPDILEGLCAYEFFEQYETTRYKKDNPDILSFLRQHPGKNLDGVKKRTVYVVPILGFSDFVNTIKFEGNNILSIDPMDPEISHDIKLSMEQYAKQVVMIFTPWRDQTVLDLSTAEVILHFQQVYKAKMIKPLHITMLQNIQDCYDSLACDIPPDPLESCTENTISINKSVMDQRQADFDQLLAEEMTEMAAIVAEAMFPDGHDRANNESISNVVTLEQLRAQGTNNCGFHLLHNPTLPVVDEDFISIQVEPIQSLSANGDNNIPSSEDGFIDASVTHERLFQLVFRSSTRNVDTLEDHLQDMDTTGSIHSITTWAQRAFTNPQNGEMDKHQKRAFEVIIASFLLTYLEEANANSHKEGSSLHRSYRREYLQWRQELLILRGIGNTPQLIAFLSGPGGSGKSHLISMVMKYAKGFTKILKVPFTKRTIVVTAMTGVAATTIRGETIHSAAMLLSEKDPSLDQIKTWSNARLLILDEISFAGQDVIIKLDRKLRELKENNGSLYGGMNVVFSGDFYQLEPVAGDPLYASLDCWQWHNGINCYLELQGSHRFTKDPKYGQIMARFREGKATLHDLRTLNSRVVTGHVQNEASFQQVAANMSYATFYNKDKEAINGGIFHHHISATHSTDPLVQPPLHTIIIKASEVRWRPGKRKKHMYKLTQSFQNKLFSECGAHAFQRSGQYTNQHIDPFLKLHLGIPLQFTLNVDVPNGIANGTLCYLKSVKLKAHMAGQLLPKYCVDGYYVNVVSADDVEYLLCQHANSNETFKVEAEPNVGVNVKLHLQKMLRVPSADTKQPKTVVFMTLTQFPVLVNHASTGHKLQGQTKQNLCISSWSYSKNWPYVQLSRVTALIGLFLRDPLKEDPSKYSTSNLLHNMLTKFRQRSPKDLAN